MGDPDHLQFDKHWVFFALLLSLPTVITDACCHVEASQHTTYYYFVTVGTPTLPKHSYR